MSHMVIYRGVDGKPGYQQAEDIHDAVAFVEQMRNEEGVEQARIFRLEEVTFEYRPYYRVELNNGVHHHDPHHHEPPYGAPTPMVGATQMSAPADRLEDLPAPTAEDSYDLSDPSATIDVDRIDDVDLDAEAVGTNGARRGLFGR